ncbi:two-component sensor histidine kinase [Flavobacterium aciduliphilum]|uniref:histidine kinase n=2 Tax=Flavobacterium aciduliphilum TaxID=1101402 RepID=A0A328YNZ4_9FLAO|nr:two-component sensor histidine kinase [Flavobacterium aciduliphilum]
MEIATYKYYAELLKTTAQKKKDYNALGLYSLLNASYLVTKGDYKGSIENSNKASIIFKKNNNKQKYLDALFYNAVANYYNGNISFAEKEATDALIEAKKHHFYNQIASLQYFLGCSYARKNQLDKALKAQNIAILYFQKTKNDFGVINCYNEVITLYIYNENWDKATEYSDLILQLAAKLENLDIQTKSLLYTTVAAAYNGAKLYTKGLKYALKANKINLDIGNLEIIVNNLNVLTELYSSLKQTDLAIKYCKIILQYPVSDKYKLEAYNLLAKNYQIKKNYKSALYYQTKSVGIVNMLNNSDRCSNEIYRVLYKDLATIQYLLGDYTNAYRYLLKYTELNNKVVKNEKEKDINALLLKFDSKEKKIRLKQLEIQNKNKELTLKNQKYYLVLITSLLLASILILIILIIFYLKIYKKNKLILSQKNNLENFSKQVNDSLNVKNVLLKELHHRVKNNMQIIMSLLNIQAKESKNKSIQEFVTKAEDRIQSMSLIHRSLYESESVDKIDFKNYLEQLLVHFENARLNSGQTISIAIDIDSIYFDIITAIPLGLIINELLLNVYKHAFPNNFKGSISIIFEKIDEKEYIIYFKDNGVGYSESHSKNTLGLELVEMLIKQLQGTFVKLTDVQGTHYKIFFKEQTK